MKPILSFALLCLAAPLLLPAAKEDSSKMLPNGPGKDAVLHACTSCHGAKNFVKYRKNADEWSEVVADMETRGAVFDDQEAGVVIDYLAKYFGKNAKAAKADAGAARETQTASLKPTKEAAALPGAALNSLNLTGEAARLRKSHDWLTWGNDSRRTGWAQSETAISPNTVANLELKWKAQIDTQVDDAVEAALTEPVIVSGVKTGKGEKTLVFTLAASNTLVALDAANGAVVWQKKFTNKVEPAMPASWLCTNTPNATPVIDKKKGLIYALSGDGVLHGLTLDNGEDKIAPIDLVPPYSRNWSLNLIDGILYTTVGRGCGSSKTETVASHMIAIDLNDPAHPIAKFYTSAGRPAGAWGRGGAVAGPGGLYYQTADGAFEPASNKYGNTLLNLAPRTLQVLDYFVPPNTDLLNKKDLDFGSSGPATFPFQNWELVAAAGKDATVYLLDAKSLGGSDHHTPLFGSRYGNDEESYAGNGVWGSMATSVDAKGNRWLYVPMWGPVAKDAKFSYTNGDAEKGSVMGFRLTVQNGKPALDAVWVSRNLAMPDPPVIANGVLFALSTGENTVQRTTAPLPPGEKEMFRMAPRPQEPGEPARPRVRGLTARERLQNTEHAVLYGLDATTGKELYSSKDQIDDWTHFSGLTVSNGTVYVITRNSRVYAFSVKSPGGAVARKSQTTSSVH
jgi:outer membrane protein assembly factor BamB